MSTNNDSITPQSRDMISGTYDVHELIGDGFTRFHEEGLFLTLDGDRVWGYIELHSLKGMFCVHRRPQSMPSGNMGTYCRCRVYGEDGSLRVYDGTKPAPCQHINFVRDGSVTGMVRHGRRREDYRRFEACRVADGQTRSEIGPEKMREMWEDMVSDQ